MAAAGDRHHRRDTAARERRCGCVGTPARRRGSGPRPRVPSAGRAVGAARLAISGRDLDSFRVRRDVVGRALPGDHRRRPAQVFYGFPNRWDVGMSKPNAFACSATPLCSCRGGRIRTFRSRSRRALPAPGTPVARTRPDDDLARSTERAPRRRFGQSARAPDEVATNKAPRRDRQTKSSRRGDHQSRQPVGFSICYRPPAEGSRTRRVPLPTEGSQTRVGSV